MTTEEGRERTFWVGLAVGWTAYFVLNLFLIVSYEGFAFDLALLVTVANVLPPALASIPVAASRRRLLQPEWSLVRTVGTHLVVGGLFAATAAGLAMVAVQLVGTSGGLAEAADGFRFPLVFVTSLFIYVIFFGFLMWSESVRRVQESHRLAAREAVLRAEAEARAIRARFNPHFVFNTLHSLMLLVRADPAQAERAIEDVATLIRYASIIQRRDIDAVPLSKELEVVRRYLALERLRLEDRLRVEWSVDLDPETATIPAFAVQTLVENAVKHGIEPIPEGGRVTVAVGRHQKRLEISVRDDGRGAEAAEVDAAKGRGLDLLRSRLHARYQDAGELSWTTPAGGGFEAVLRLPLETPGPVPALDVIEGRREPAGVGEK